MIVKQLCAAAAGYAIESEGRTLVVWGDMVHVAAVQFPHPTATWSESDSRLALAQRLKHFADASKKGYYVALAHVAFPGIGRLRAEGSGYVWVPVVYSTSVTAPAPAASIAGESFAVSTVTDERSCESGVTGCSAPQAPSSSMSAEIGKSVLGTSVSNMRGP